MLEREVKLAYTSIHEARTAVAAAGASLLRPRRLQRDTLFDTAEQSLRERGCALRVRDDAGRRVLTFKGPIQPAAMKLREEFETAVDDGDALVRLLAALGYHRWFDGRRELYRPSVREWVEMGEQRAVTGARYAAIQAERRDMAAAWAAWFDEHRISAVLEPTLPIVAPPRGDGYETAGSDAVLISLTHFWDWTGFPVVAFPAGAGSVSGLPVSASLIGRGGQDWDLLALGSELEAVFRS